MQKSSHMDWLLFAWLTLVVISIIGLDALFGRPVFQDSVGLWQWCGRVGKKFLNAGNKRSHFFVGRMSKENLPRQTWKPYVRFSRKCST